MPTVVTGAAGFIGRHVVARLRAGGHQVVGIDRRSWHAARGELAVLGDLAAPTPEVLRALGRADAVIHVAGRPGVRDATPGIEVLRHRDNVLAGEVVCTAVPDAVPLAVVSSSSIYGGVAPRGRHLRPSAEDDMPRPVGGYAQSKVALEVVCRRRAERGGHVAVLRPFTVAGEGQRPDMALSRWINAALQGRPLVLLGDPDRRRDVTDVRDVAEGIVRAVERDLRATCNLGTGVARRLVQLASCVAAHLGVELRTVLRPAGPDEVAVTRASTDRCRRLLGFVPQTDLDALVRRQIAATLSRPFTPARLPEAV